MIDDAVKRLKLANPVTWLFKCFDTHANKQIDFGKISVKTQVVLMSSLYVHVFFVLQVSGNKPILGLPSGTKTIQIFL